MELAKIHLKSKKDITSFLQCYDNVGNFDRIPTSKVQTFVGDTYSNAAYHRHALDVYYTLFDLHKDDESLARTLGEKLITCQEFHEACNQYESIVNTTSDLDLFLDLIDLYVDIRKFSNALESFEQIFDNEVLRKMNETEVTYMKLLQHVIEAMINHDKTRFEYRILLKVMKEFQMSKKSLTDARTTLQSKTLRKMKQILSKLVVLFLKSSDPKGEVADTFDLIFEIVDNDDEIMLAAMELAYSEKNIEICKNHCNEMLKKFPSNEMILVVCGRLLVNRQKLEDASKLYKDFLSSYPYSYIVILDYLQLMNRMGDYAGIKSIGEKLTKMLSCRATNLSSSYYMCKVRLMIKKKFVRLPY